VHISELGADYYSFQASSMSLVGERSGDTFGLGDELRVKVDSVQPSRGRINLLPVGNDDKPGQSRRNAPNSRGPKTSGNKSNSKPSNKKPASKKTRAKSKANRKNKVAKSKKKR